MGVRADREILDDDEWLSVEECIEYYVDEQLKYWSDGRESKDPASSGSAPVKSVPAKGSETTHPPPVPDEAGAAAKFKPGRQPDEPTAKIQAPAPPQGAAEVPSEAPAAVTDGPAATASPESPAVLPAEGGETGHKKENAENNDSASDPVQVCLSLQMDAIKTFEKAAAKSPGVNGRLDTRGEDHETGKSVEINEWPHLELCVVGLKDPEKVGFRDLEGEKYVAWRLTKQCIAYENIVAKWHQWKRITQLSSERWASAADASAPVAITESPVAEPPVSAANGETAPAHAPAENASMFAESVEPPAPATNAALLGVLAKGSAADEVAAASAPVAEAGRPATQPAEPVARAKKQRGAATHCSPGQSGGRSLSPDGREG
jgi:hypothetical protein